MVQFANTKNELEKIFVLRYEVLRKPWHQSFESASDNLENSSFNAYINKNNSIVACGRLQINSNIEGQIRYMAVHPNERGKKYGQIILIALEQKAHELNLKSITLQARENALNFYLKNDYKIVEKTFLLYNCIQHYLMQRDLSPI